MLDICGTVLVALASWRAATSPRAVEGRGVSAMVVLVQEVVIRPELRPGMAKRPGVRAAS
jgi:hypothetical protein